MKLSCTQENLQKGVNIVSKIIGSKASLPVLNNILLTTDNGRLKLSSTDLEIGINTWIGAKVDEEGKITVPARLLSEFISTNDDQTIELATKEDTLTLKSEKYQANIKGINAAEFPLIPEISDSRAIELDSKKLLEVINRVVMASAHDETRPVLTGVFLRLLANSFKMVATDSYRLAEATVSLEKKNSHETNIIIPGRTMVEVARIFPFDNPGTIKISLSENQVLFSFKNTQIISRLIEGNFPDYEQIIPRSRKTKIVLNVGKLTNSIKMASFFARESANNIKIMAEGGEKILVSAISPQVGDTISELKPELFEGESTEIAFNAKFMLDILNVIADENLDLEINGKINPVVIKPSKTKGYLYIVMPLRVEE